MPRSFAKSELMRLKDAVRAKGDFTQEEVPDGVNAIALAQDERVHHIALGLAHLGAVAKQQPAVAVNLLWQG